MDLDFPVELNSQSGLKALSPTLRWPTPAEEAKDLLQDAKAELELLSSDSWSW